MIKQVIYLLLVLVVLVSVCMHTKPGKEEHVDEVTACVTEGLRSGSFSQTGITDEKMSRIESEQMLRPMIEKMILFDEYVLFSLCKVKGADDEYLLSIGVLDNVFVLSKEGMTEKIFLNLRQKKIID